MVNACQNKTDRKSEWIKGLIARRNKNIATVALANKNARIIWAVLSRGEDYRRGETLRDTGSSRVMMTEGWAEMGCAYWTGTIFWDMKSTSHPKKIDCSAF